MTIEGISTNNTSNTNIVMPNLNDYTAVTETMDLDEYALNAYNKEMAKYENRLRIAHTMFNDAKTKLNSYLASAANVSTSSVKSTIKYDEKSLSNLMESALDQLSSNIQK